MHVFLSAGVPVAGREPYFSTSDATAIATAISALVLVTLGRRVLVWGGHPAITPMIWSAANDLSVNYGEWVKLFQSRYFEDEFPEENLRFRNVTYVDAVVGDRDRSLFEMRRQMISSHAFQAGIFIGGMEGVVAEFDLFRKLHPRAPAYPIPSTGAAALVLQGEHRGLPQRFVRSIDYVGAFHTLLNVRPTEKRFVQARTVALDPGQGGTVLGAKRELWRLHRWASAVVGSLTLASTYIAKQALVLIKLLLHLLGVR